MYPFFIRMFSILGYLHAMLVVNVIASIALCCVFLYALKTFSLTKKTFLLATVFMFLPRFLVVRTVGAPESLFMLFVLASVVFFEKKNYLLAGVLGAFAVMTKTPGILLFVAYLFVFFEQFAKQKKVSFSWLWIVLIPCGLFSVFVLYGIQTGDYFAYFHSGDNIHLMYPFAVFDGTKPWIGTAWLEDVLFYFFLYALAVYQLREIKQRSFFYFSLIFFIATVFIQHRDISRYSLPLWPFACIAFERLFTSKKFLIVGFILLPAIILYVWNFLSFNIMPITQWLPFM